MTDGINYDEWNAKHAGAHSVAPDLGLEVKAVNRTPMAASLAAWMVFRQFSFFEMARTTGLPIETLLHLINGDRAATPDEAVRLARAFEVSMPDLASGPAQGSMGSEIPMARPKPSMVPIRAWMEAKGCSDIDLAISLGMDRPALHRLINGSREITFDCCKLLAAQFRISIPELLMGPPPSPINPAAERNDRMSETYEPTDEHQMTPNPGSEAAVSLGCTCPAIDNGHGLGSGHGDKQFWITEGCPLHARSPSPKPESP